MFTKVLLCCFVSYVAAQYAADPPPQPYSFSYDNTDEFGTRQTREETSDSNNRKTGSYSFTDANGVSRLAKYVADENGFRVTVETNEEGTETHYPGDAEIISRAPKVAPFTPPKPARPVVQVQSRPVVHTVHTAPVQVQTVHASPVHVHAVHAEPIQLHAVHATPVQLHAIHAVHAPVLHAVSPLSQYTLHAAPISYATAHHVTPILSHAPLTYTLGRAKSR